jgi:uncharacterized protein
MTIEFSPYEARIIGCLLEKEITTPEQYPLSLNALTNACNQKSNRDPVLYLDETTVQQTLDGLNKKYLVSEESGYGSRVAKYRHRFCNTEYGTLKFSPGTRHRVRTALAWSANPRRTAQPCQPPVCPERCGRG